MPAIGQEPTTRFLTEYESYTLHSQVSIPTCATTPITCNLGISGYTTTDVTQRGDSDGQIYVAVTGNTGTTMTWLLNGVSYGTHNTPYTFTGLTSGFYTVIVEEGDCFTQQTDIQVLDGDFRTGDFDVTSPPELSVSENPIILTLETAVNSGAPFYSKGYFQVNGTVSDGDSITFSFTYPKSYTAVFYAKEFPNRDSYFLASVLKNGLGVSVGTNDASEISTSLGEALLNDSVISRVYDIRISNDKVYLSAREPNNKLDLSTVATISASNITLTETDNGVAQYDGQITENYSLYANLYVNQAAQYGEVLDTDTFSYITQLELPFNMTNEHLFDMSQILKNFVSTPKIDFTLTGFTTIDSMMSAYRFEYGEKYPLVENTTTKKSRKKGESDILYVVNGALEWETDNDYSSVLGDYLHNIKADFGVSFDIQNPTTNDVTITIQNYLFDTGETKTTNIQFRIEDQNNLVNYGWQTGNTFVLTGGFLYRGNIKISGTTSGITSEYVKTFYSVPYWGSGYTFLNAGKSPDVRTGVNFLTNSPSPKFIQRDSSEFLYVILPKDYGKSLKIKGDLYFYDGTSLTGETLYDITTGTTNWGGVFCLAAGYNELNLESYESYSGGTRKIRRLDFALYQEDALNGEYKLSETKSYRYEIDEQPRRYGVAFLNKLGTYDIFDFTGEIIDSISHDSETYQVPRQINRKGASPFGFQSDTVFGTKVVNRIQANTGWIDSDHFDWLKEMVESNRIYNYTLEDQPFLIIESVNYQKSSNDDLYNIDITFRETLYENNVGV